MNKIDSLLLELGITPNNINDIIKNMSIENQVMNEIDKILKMYNLTDSKFKAIVEKYM